MSKTSSIVQMSPAISIARQQMTSMGPTVTEAAMQMAAERRQELLERMWRQQELEERTQALADIRQAEGEALMNSARESAEALRMGHEGMLAAADPEELAVAIMQSLGAVTADEGDDAVKQASVVVRRDTDGRVSVWASKSSSVSGVRDASAVAYTMPSGAAGSGYLQYRAPNGYDRLARALQTGAVTSLLGGALGAWRGRSLGSGLKGFGIGALGGGALGAVNPMSVREAWDLESGLPVSNAEERRLAAVRDALDPGSASANIALAGPETQFRTRPFGGVAPMSASALDVDDMVAEDPAAASAFLAGMGKASQDRGDRGLDNKLLAYAAIPGVVWGGLGGAFATGFGGVPALNHLPDKPRTLIGAAGGAGLGASFGVGTLLAADAAIQAVARHHRRARAERSIGAQAVMDKASEDAETARLRRASEGNQSWLFRDRARERARHGLTLTPRQLRDFAVVEGDHAVSNLKRNGLHLSVYPDGTGYVAGTTPTSQRTDLTTNILGGMGIGGLAGITAGALGALRYPTAGGRRARMIAGNAGIGAMVGVPLGGLVGNMRPLPMDVQRLDGEMWSDEDTARLAEYSRRAQDADTEYRDMPVSEALAFAKRPETMGKESGPRNHFRALAHTGVSRPQNRAARLATGRGSQIEKTPAGPPPGRVIDLGKKKQSGLFSRTRTLEYSVPGYGDGFVEGEEAPAMAERSAVIKTPTRLGASLVEASPLLGGTLGAMLGAGVTRGFISKTPTASLLGGAIGAAAGVADGFRSRPFARERMFRVDAEPGEEQLALDVANTLDPTMTDGLSNAVLTDRGFDAPSTSPMTVLFRHGFMPDRAHFRH